MTPPLSKPDVAEGERQRALELAEAILAGQHFSKALEGVPAIAVGDDGRLLAEALLAAGMRESKSSAQMTRPPPADLGGRVSWFLLFAMSTGWALVCDRLGWGHYGHWDMFASKGWWGGSLILLSLWWLLTQQTSGERATGATEEGQ